MVVGAALAVDILFSGDETKYSQHNTRVIRNEIALLLVLEFCNPNKIRPNKTRHVRGREAKKKNS